MTRGPESICVALMQRARAAPTLFVLACMRGAGRRAVNSSAQTRWPAFLLGRAKPAKRPVLFHTVLTGTTLPRNSVNVCVQYHIRV